MRIEEWKELFDSREGTDHYEKYFATGEAIINAMPLPMPIQSHLTNLRNPHSINGLLIINESSDIVFKA